MTLEQYRSLVVKTHCRWCHAVLPQKIESYDHPEGWTVDGFPQKQWLYITCENPLCDYQWSLSKLGVARE